MTAVPGAVDAHVHVVEPGRRRPPSGPGYRPRPDEAGTAEELAAVLAAHGIEAAVVVQLSGDGFENGPVLDALARSEGRWRGVAALPPDAPDRELDRLDAAGVRGVRFNVLDLGREALAASGRLLDALAERGWVAQVQCAAPDLPAVAGALRPERGPVLLDHLGRPDPARGRDEPGFRLLLELGRRNAFLKLSGAFRSSREPAPHPDLDPFVADLLDAYGAERRVWGSDWPFVNLPRRPSYASTLDQLRRWLPDEGERRLALVDNPRRLFGFGGAHG